MMHSLLLFLQVVVLNLLLASTPTDEQALSRAVTANGIDLQSSESTTDSCSPNQPSDAPCEAKPNPDALHAFTFFGSNAFGANVMIHAFY
jgi:hypothetical protein